MNHQRWTLELLPTKVENFIRRLDRETQERINLAFAYITGSPFRHENPATIRKLHGKKKGFYRYRIGTIRFIYRVNSSKRLIRIVQIDNRGDIY